MEDDTNRIIKSDSRIFIAKYFFMKIPKTKSKQIQLCTFGLWKRERIAVPGA